MRRRGAGRRGRRSDPRRRRGGLDRFSGRSGPVRRDRAGRRRRSRLAERARARPAVRGVRGARGRCADPARHGTRRARWLRPRGAGIAARDGARARPDVAHAARPCFRACAARGGRARARRPRAGREGLPPPGRALPAIVYRAEVGEAGAWTYVSPQIESILGFSPEEWCADPTLWEQRLHPEDRDRAIADEEAAAAGISIGSCDYRMLARDGRVVWLADDAVVERDDEGRSYWHGVLYDISDRKRAEAELQLRAAQQAAVAQLGQSALEGQDLAGLMHEAVSTAASILAVECAHVLELRPAPEGFIERATLGWPEDIPAELAARPGTACLAALRDRARGTHHRARLARGAALRAAAGARRSRPAQRHGGRDQRAGAAVRRARAAHAQAAGLPRGRHQLRAVAGERPGGSHRPPRRGGRDAPPRAARPAHPPPEQDPVRRPARPRPAAVAPARHADGGAVLRHRPLQADQRQPRPRRRRRAADRGRPAAQGGAAPRRHRRALRRRRVRRAGRGS